VATRRSPGTRRCSGSIRTFAREVEGEPAYIEWRIGEYQHEFGLLHSVVDPFGNVLGVMVNQHYLDVLAR
jgi:hypothetical protein